MALDDIIFVDGDIQNFILEIPSGILYAPLDQSYSASVNDFILEFGNGSLHAPTDWLMDSFTANAVLFNNLTLIGGGASYFAF